MGKQTEHGMDTGGIIAYVGLRVISLAATLLAVNSGKGMKTLTVKVCWFRAGKMQSTMDTTVVWVIPTYSTCP